jgi:aspartyl-tRNA(Asn)/glutamyl-tRNA(Gln) amidotransferase subunit C
MAPGFGKGAAACVVSGRRANVVIFTGCLVHHPVGNAPMSLSADDVAKIAHLARLAVEPQQSEVLGRELSKILDLVAQMDAVDTSAVTPMAHPLEMAQRLRPDQVTEGDQRDRYQAHAPAVENGLFLVPKVIE